MPIATRVIILDTPIHMDTAADIIEEAMDTAIVAATAVVTADRPFAVVAAASMVAAALADAGRG
jgi:hypothetical protein